MPGSLKTSTPDLWRHAREVLVALSVIAIFFDCTWRGLLVTFNYDDIMNLNFAWAPPLKQVLASNLAPFTTFYRPAGALYYRFCFDVFGWNPASFRAVTYAFLLANIFLVYLLCRRLVGVAQSGSQEMAVLAALLYSFHSRFAQIYVSNGTVYDVVCATFSLLTLWWYVRLRQKRAQVKWWEWALLYGLFTAALNAKEMAAILPAMFALYEWLYHGPETLRVRTLSLWLWKQGRIPALALTFAVLAAWGKTHAGSVFFAHPLYTPEYSLKRLLQNEAALIGDLIFSRSGPPSGWNLVWLYAALFAGAAISKQRYLWFFAWLALLSPLPVVFIPYRGFFVMYGPYAAWAMYAGAALVLGRQWLWRVVWNRAALAAGTWEPERVFLFVAVAVFVLHERGDAYLAMTRDDEQQIVVAQSRRDLLRLHEPLPTGARVYLERSRFRGSGFEPMQLMRLTYRDRDLWVDRPAAISELPDQATLAKYDRVLDFDGQKLVVLQKGAKDAAGRQLEYPR